ncbi:hypothetical protein DC366_16930 [Pelagivirga sediminicola]|uniref:DUF1403 domain-containing protein n=1 Tax=Pelagivirga sediminicola TaxID=2170575 RepID=A0A2T7G382_9RHOB|nr:DUF1403 family protein [Pelagivirga sediminicola]PVA08872.1 hypothetical protein DC366_16930 [Pelagivirga sediminicola]
MTYQPGTISNDLTSLPKLPSWVTSARTETPEDVAFLSGAALAHLHLVLSREDVPQALLRERLALKAAETCVAHSGRVERAQELRDAVQFLQPGDNPGPAGEIYLYWRRGIERPVSVKTLHRALPDVELEQIGEWLDAGQGAPIPRAASVMQAVIEERSRDGTAALLTADAALAQALGWSHVLPLLAFGLKRGDLRRTGEDLHLACHRAATAAADEATREAANLTRRAARLRDVAPKLRAKGAEDAVALFLARDSVAPTALTSLRSDRAARRFCDRLVELGAVRELTGRDTFRLYGI